MGIIRQVKIEKTGSIYLILANEQGRDCWFYVRVSRLKEPLLEADLKKDTLSISDYGDTIYSGWGSEPDYEIAQLIQNGEVH